MVKRTKTNNFATEEALEKDRRRDSDSSDEDQSEEESDLSECDSVEEYAEIHGGDAFPDEPSDGSDADWEPVQKSARTQDTSNDSETALDLSVPKRGAAGSRLERSEAPPSGEGRWSDTTEPDIVPQQPVFRPSRTPGSQLISTFEYSCVELFQLFFPDSTILTILANTNQYGRSNVSSDKTPWTDITKQDFFSFLSVVLYMSYVRCSSLTDYWRRGNQYSLHFPSNVISAQKWLKILQVLHFSSAKDDAANVSKKGTRKYDRLGKLKPLYTKIREACRQHFHPGQEIAIDERTVASKARQHMKAKPVKRGFKLYVLADSSNGYIWDYFIYEGKADPNGGKGLTHDAVQKLLNTKVLGTGYKLYVDNFYTSPALFTDLLEKRIWACGAIKANRNGFPKTTGNALDKNSEHGSIRWIRKDSVLFVQWRDTRDVCLCSTLHTAHAGDTVGRNVRDGRWTRKEIPVPPAVKDYSRCMGGVHISDAPTGYHQVLQKTRKWYKTLFFHLVDIAVVNAFLLHKEQCKLVGVGPLAQKAYRETLADQLMDLGPKRSASAALPAPRLQHRLTYITQDRTAGRRRCRMCQFRTAVKCDKPLCFVPTRDCYNRWHTRIM
ncbi:piggyBac transposable element-derived protein 4-like [Poecilia reticulata]|uniref:piggyBac transposable element-derived protein 4-like n=1 Tax=Poecilia reticulata TaxID=8081 RepID=UPI0004A2181E|nr:PREDICTED: piggyBac transposable element-derived protein 4-like [Poecilia reticulata]